MFHGRSFVCESELYLFCLFEGAPNCIWNARFALMGEWNEWIIISRLVRTSCGFEVIYLPTDKTLIVVMNLAWLFFETLQHVGHLFFPEGTTRYNSISYLSHGNFTALTDNSNHWLVILKAEKSFHYLNSITVHRHSTTQNVCKDIEDKELKQKQKHYKTAVKICFGWF